MKNNIKRWISVHLNSHLTQIEHFYFYDLNRDCFLFIKLYFNIVTSVKKVLFSRKQLKGLDI